MSGRIVGIDVLRGVAVALVMARHAAPDVFAGAGVVGVVMFFALSGHLITGVLMAELERTGGLRLGRFYARRARRLLPALLVMLLGFTAVTWAFDPLGDREHLPATWLTALTWTANLPGRPESAEAAFHLWTLSGEEQFYLVWPLLLLLAWRGRRLALAVAGAAAIAALGLGLTALWLWEVPDNAYVLPTSWALAFVIGGASRIWLPRASVPGGVGAALACLALLALVPLRGEWLTYAVVGPLVAAATVVLLWAARDHHAAHRDVPRWWGPLAALGTVSYAAYLWNYPLALWLRPFGPVGAVAAVLATVALAAASWRWVEKPFARWAARRWDAERGQASGSVPRAAARESVLP